MECFLKIWEIAIVVSGIARIEIEVNALRIYENKKACSA